MWFEAAFISAKSTLTHYFTADHFAGQTFVNIDITIDCSSRSPHRSIAVNSRMIFYTLAIFSSFEWIRFSVCLITTITTTKKRWFFPTLFYFWLKNRTSFFNHHNFFIWLSRFCQSTKMLTYWFFSWDWNYKPTKRNVVLFNCM